MPNSRSFQQFKEALEMAEELLKLEQQYRNPPRQNEQKAVRGLRGAAAVLMVAAFENFLRESMEEHLSKLSQNNLKLQFQKLPDKFRISSVYNSLDRAMKGPPFQEAPPKIDRLADIERICKVIISGQVDPSVFIDTGGNPSPKNIKVLYSNIALENIFSRVRPKFDRKWGKPEAFSFVEDKLQEVVNRRHVVAHTADALKITRGNLREALRFLEILAHVLDMELEDHIKHLVKLCT